MTRFVEHGRQQLARFERREDRLWAAMLDVHAEGTEAALAIAAQVIDASGLPVGRLTVRAVD